MALLRLTALWIYVTDLAASLHFYRIGLGAVPLFEPAESEGYATLRLGDVEWHLQAIEAEESVALRSWLAAGPRGVGIMPAVQVADVVRLAQTLSQAGGGIISGPLDQPWGVRELVVEDPDGYRLLLWHGAVEHGLPLW